MASLRTTAATRLLRAACQARPIVPAGRRFESSVATTAAPVLQQRQPDEPDYGAHIDKATSTFTPVPRRLLDGSEDTDALPAAVLSGAPMELQARTVRIFKPSKPATQSGDWSGKRWRMDWDSSGDVMQGTHINFKTKEDAIAFAEKQGYEYFVQEPNQRRILPKAYANNFLYSPTKLKTIRTK